VSPTHAHLPSLCGSHNALCRAIKTGERPPDDPAFAQVRPDLKFARMSDWIVRAMAEDPPLSDDQRTELADILLPTEAR
jgi:hypothetical protein